METIEKIKTIAAKIFGASKEEKLQGSGLQRPVAKEMESYDKTAIREDRRSKIIDCLKMGALDDRVARLYEKISGDATINNFSISVESAPTEQIKNKSQSIIDSVVDQCEIFRKLEGWVESCLKEGDMFLEIIVDEKTKEIIRLKKLAAVITFRNINSEGNFPENEPAYYQEHPFSREKIRTFENWQICYIPRRYIDGQPYSEPLFASSRLTWERLDNAEKNIVIRRAIRSGLRRHHRVGAKDRPGSWEEVLRYKNENVDTLSNPMDAAQDFYTTGNIEITELQGDSSLGDISDIEFFEGKLVMRAGVPYALLGGGREKNINRDILEEQEEDYYRVIQSINDSFEVGLRQVFDFALLLQGINIESVKYSFNWGAKDRDDIDKKLARAEIMQRLGFSFETIFKTVDLDVVTIEEEVERIQKQVEDGVIPYGVGMKLDPNMLMALMGTSQNGTNEELIEQIKRLNEFSEKQTSPGARIDLLDNLRKFKVQ
jgi:hypothetical protein